MNGRDLQWNYNILLQGKFCFMGFAPEPPMGARLPPDPPAGGIAPPDPAEGVPPRLHSPAWKSVHTSRV